MCSEEKQELINSFIDGELKVPDQIQLFKHLAECSDCQAFIDTLMRIREIEKREKIKCPADVDEAILNRISQKMRTDISGAAKSEKPRVFRIKGRITVPIPAAIAAAAAAIIIGFLLSGIFYRGTAPSSFPVTLTQQQTQPTAIIYIYSMPPMEVISTAMVQTLNNHNKQIY